MHCLHNCLPSFQATRNFLSRLARESCAPDSDLLQQIRIRAHPRGAFNSVGACTPTELKLYTVMNNKNYLCNSIKFVVKYCYNLHLRNRLKLISHDTLKFGISHFSGTMAGIKQGIHSSQFSSDTSDIFQIRLFIR